MRRSTRHDRDARRRTEGLRWLGSGPRTGLGELIFPANEPGSSIMPGKVNPTQAEAMLMVAIQVIASDVAVTMGGAEGNFELNAFRPVLISNYLHSALIMADMCDHFRQFMVEGTRLNQATLKENIDRSVMMVTALAPVIGYDKAAAISYYAIDHDLTLKEAALPRAYPRTCTTRSSSPSTSPAPAPPTCPPDKGLLAGADCVPERLGSLPDVLISCDRARRAGRRNCRQFTR